MAGESLRLIHIADAHLDTSFYGREESLRRKLREACRQAFKNAIGEAITRNAHAVLIAGDMFDNARLSFATEQFLLEEMKKLKEAGIKVFYATGNHDPGGASYRAHELDWPGNVHLFLSNTPETVSLYDREGRVIGKITAAGHNSGREEENLAKKFEKASDEVPHIGLLHTQVMSAKEAQVHQRYAPCSESDLEEKKYDYWALGHVHVRQNVGDETSAWYAGNLQGRNPKETGPKGCLYVELNPGTMPEPEFLPVSTLVWHEITVPLSPSIALWEPLANHILEQLRKRIDIDHGRDHLIRVNLSGESPLAGELEETENLNDLREKVQMELELAWLDIRVQSLVKPIELDEFRGGPSVLAEVLELIERLEEDDDLLEEVMPEEIAAVNVKDKKEYMRKLMNGMDKQVASLLKEKT